MFGQSMLRFVLSSFAIAIAALAAPQRADANCNLIPASQREFRSTLGTVDRTLVAPGSRIAVRTDLACAPTADGFAADPALSRIFVRFVPPAASGNPALETEFEIPTGSITPANCAVGGRCDTLLFFFPDAATLDAALAPNGDGLGLTGPVRVRVENLAAEVQIDVGPLFEPTLGCDDQQADTVFGHLTALPTPNSFGALSGGADTSLEATVDGNGNLLIPMDYSALFPGGGAGSAVFRILEASAAFDAFASSPGVPIVIPASGWLRSFNLAGRPIPPVLETNANGDTVLGSVDAQLSVLRIARLDPDAPGAPLYEVGDRLFAGRGPIVIAGASANARESAPLSTLSADGFGIAFASLELAGDLNGDFDTSDRVPQVIDVATGAGLNTAAAVTEVTTPGFVKPLLQTADGLLAFGLSEGRQDYSILNGDRDRMDSLLRVYSTTGDGFSAGETIDPTPVVDGKPISISNELVFHRTAEADAAVRSTALITPTVLEPFQQRGDSTSPSLSGDGRYVAFDSRGGATFTTEALPHDGYFHIFVYDRVAGTYELIDRTAGGVKGDRHAFAPSISRDGRWVAYHSEATNLAGADADAFLPDVFLYDRQTATTVCLSCSEQPDGGDAVYPSLSPDASHVAYGGSDRIRIWERASGTTTNLLAEFPPFSIDADFFLEGITPSISDGGRYVVERFTVRLGEFGLVLTDQVLRFDRETLQVAFIAPGDLAEISADGTTIAFQSDTDLVTDDTNAASDAYVWDERQGIEIISVNTEGETGNGGVGLRPSAVSDDGRFVAYVDDSGAQIPEFPSNRQVFRFDRTTNVVEAVSISNAGDASSGMNNTLAISGDGHTVAFAGFGSNLDPGAYEDIQNVYVRSGAGTSLNAADTDAFDTVLQAFDPASNSYRQNLRVPASAVAAAAGRAAILSSEAEDGGIDRNGNGVATDTVARIADGLADTVTETGLAAAAVAISDSVACIAVDEAAQGQGALNGDGDADDLVLFVRDLAADQQTNTGVAVTAANFAAAGTYCVYTTPESAEAGTPDLNEDGDTDDAVLGVYDAATAIPTSFPYATEDLVAKGEIVAFRVCEDQQFQTDLNFDGDVIDAPAAECIMHVLRLASGEVENTQRAAEACRLPGCDPFFEPYRVTANSVSFLTNELVQSGSAVLPGTPLAVDCKPVTAGPPGSCDLSGDDDTDDRMISVYGVESRRAQLIPVLAPGESGQDISPFPTEIGDSGVLYVQLLETQVGEDVNGDGEITDTPVVVLVGDIDGDGTLDDAVNRNDTCIEVANPDQIDDDRDQLGDDACDPAPTESLPGDLACDVDSNGQIDRVDADLIFGDRGAAARASDPRDPDGDGAITVLDVSECRARCTFQNCRTTPVSGNACGFGAEVALMLGAIGALRRRRPRGPTLR